MIAGGIGANGDISRQWGINGVSKGGDLNTNRAKVTIEDTVFTDLDVVYKPGVLSALGGAMTLNFAQLNMSNSMILLSDATASVPGASGGAFAALVQTDAQLTNVTMANNTAEFGGAIFTQGSNFNFSGGKLLNNVNKGVTSTNYGSVIFSAQDDGRGLNATGAFLNSTFSGNTNLAIFEDDRVNGPINDMHYNSNSMYTTNTGGVVFKSAISSNQTVAQLNTLTIQRAAGIPTTKKALSANTALSSAPATGTILGVSSKLTTGAPGDSLPTDSYLAYAWSGGSATLDGSAISNGAGYTTAGSGTHTLSVGGQSYTASLSTVTAPSLSFYGWENSVFWTLTGNALDAAADYNLAVSSGTYGGVTIPAGLSDVYIYVITKEGGIVSSPPALPYPPFPNHLYVPVVMR